MQSVLITGGAGFVGQNLVHAWRKARPADRLVVVDAMTYAANVRSLEPLIVNRSIVFAKGDGGCATPSNIGVRLGVTWQAFQRTSSTTFCLARSILVL